MSVDLGHHEIYRAKVGKGGINSRNNLLGFKEGIKPFKCE